MIQFTWGALAMGCLVVGLFFVRFWRVSRDRFFLFFVAAFWLFGLSYVALAVSTSRQADSQYQLYAIRLAGFVSIIAGIVSKNRGS
jgi:uncharacterized membrane protein